MSVELYVACSVLPYIYLYLYLCTYTYLMVGEQYLCLTEEEQTHHRYLKAKWQREHLELRRWDNTQEHLELRR